MKAVILVPGPQGAEVRVDELPKPAPVEGEALVAVHAAALNRGELVTRSNLRSGAPQGNGIEFAGEVVEVGQGVDVGWLGRRVMGHWRGGQAEFVAVDTRLLVPVPERLDWVQAGAWLNVFTTAHDALVTRAGVRSGDAVLVNAASSGIGTAAVQIAALLGAGPVLASSRSGSRRDSFRELGMDVFIDASAPDWPQAVHEATGGRGVDVIIDSVGANVLAANLQAAAIGARIVSVGRLAAERGEIDLDLLARKRISLIGVTFRTRTLEERAACVQRCAQDLLQALAEGRIAPVIDKVFPMDEIGRAHEYMARDGHFGKIVLQVRP